MIIKRDKWVGLFILTPDSVIQPNRVALQIFRGDRSELARFSSHLLFGYRNKQGKKVQTIKNIPTRWTPDQPGRPVDFDVVEDFALHAMVDHDNDPDSFPPMPVEWYRDVKRAQLVTTRLPVELIKMYKERLGERRK